MDVGGWPADRPLIEKLTVLIEDLRSDVDAIVDDYAPRARIDGDAVHVVEVAGARVVRRRAFLAPSHEVFPARLQLHDARVLVAVGDEERAVGQPRHERG